MSAWTSSHALGITIESILFIQNFVKVIHLMIEHVNITATMIPTKTVWTLHWSVRMVGVKLI